jgi:general secretion pathway protein H
MPTSAVGDAARARGSFSRQSPARLLRVAAGVRARAAASERQASRGFTLLELLLVVAIIGITVAGVVLALPEGKQTALARDADRMAALLDAARARAQAGGVPVRFRTTAEGFAFDGLAGGALPNTWLSAEVTAAEPTQIMLGPDPIIGPQQLRLATRDGGRTLLVMTDGVRPFRVVAASVVEAP